MSILTSRPDKRPNRNFLFPEEQALVHKEAKMIATELRLWLPDAERDAIMRARDAHSVMFYTEICRAIRNEYDLWLEEHHITKIWLQAEREFPLSDGVDDHPCHPDNFSAACMQKLWEILQHHEGIIWKANS